MAYNKKHMEQAIELAQNGKETEGAGSFGALITLDGKVISSCFNVVNLADDPTQHAELRCIQRACRVLKTQDLSACELYTSCAPCMMCLGAIKWAGFKNVYYGASGKMAKEAGFVYSDMYYARSDEERDKEFRMQQHLAEKARAVWSDSESEEDN